MANTYVDYTAVASQTDYNFSFEYLRDDHVKVKVNDVIVTNYTIVTSPVQLIRFDTAPTASAAIKIYRDSRGDFSPLVDFVDGSVLTESELDESYKHNLFVAQEASEGQGGEQLTKKGLTNYDAEGNKIINLGSPTTATDAATKSYVDQTIDNAELVGGSPATVSLGVYDVTSTNDTLKQLRAWTADIEDTSGSTVTATGSTTARTLANRFADVINVKDYGAVGDWNDSAQTGTNDTSAIQAAIDAAIQASNNGEARSVFFPVGEYLITSPLNLTADNGSISRRGIRLFGETAGSGDYTHGTKIVGKTSGKAIIEIIDNDNFQLENLTLINSATDGATVGIYQARRTGGGGSLWSGNCYFNNVTIKFSNDTITQNNNFGTIGIINVAGEETTYDRCEVWANLPLALSWSNTMRKSVDAMTATTYDSFEYDPVHATQADITEGFSNTVFRTNDCRFISKGFNAPTVLLHEIGSLFTNSDFTQKRSADTGSDGTNGVAYELWNNFQTILNTVTENVSTPILIHRATGALKANIRGTVGSCPGSNGIIHFGIDAPAYSFTNCDVNVDYAGSISNGFITYTTPSGVGVNEEAQVTLRNSALKINKTFADATIDSKIIYKSFNVEYGFSDHTMLADFRRLKFPIQSKSIGTPATTTDILDLTLPTAISGLSGFSATVIGNFHVSNAEAEGAGSPSSAYVKAMWNIVRDQTPSAIVSTNQTLNVLTASINSAGNNITDLTLSQTATGTDSVMFKVASVQGGANNAVAYISGDIEIIYGGGYSRAPLIELQ